MPAGDMRSDSDGTSRLIVPTLSWWMYDVPMPRHISPDVTAW